MEKVNSKTPNEITDYNLETMSPYDMEGVIPEAIQSLQETLDKYTKKGYHTVWLEVCSDGYDALHFEVCGTRTETEKEVKLRLSKWKKTLEKKKERKERAKKLKEEEEKALYKKLKNKYGDNKE